MKKIGIVTFHNAHNYGAMLQAYALQKTLKKEKTVEAEIIDYRNEKIEEQYRIIRKLDKGIKKNLKQLVSDILKYKSNIKRYKAFQKFMNENLLLSKRYYNIDELNKENLKYDVLITGSDQVWNPGIVGNLSDIYTLNFGKTNCKRISYAASIGDASLVKKYEKEFKKKLEIIDDISVREEDAAQELKSVLNRNVEVVLDPTLLLKREEWEDVISDNHISNEEKYILAYFVEKDYEFEKIVNYLSEETGLKVLHFDKRNNNYRNSYNVGYTKGPLEFVKLIKNAEYVVATSFHATVFSIIFNKKFFIVPHKKTGARVTNLLDKLGIKGRAFNNFDQFKKIDFNFETNWDEVNDKIEFERNKSIEWLKGTIK